MTPPPVAALLAQSEDADGTERRCALSQDDHRAQVHELYRKHSGSLARQVALRIGCSDLARDFVQETFAKLLGRGAGQLEQIEKPERYLRRIATNLVRDWGRANDQAKQARPTLEIEADRFVDQVALLESRDTLRLLEQVVSRMKPRTREIFLAHRVEGQSYAEIAARFGLTVKGVEWQMTKAIAKIDRALDRR